MTDEQRDSLLIEMSENLKNVNKVLDVHTKILNEHTQTLNEHTKILNEHTKTLNEHSKMLEEHSKMLKEHSSELVRIRQNMARMEHDLSDKIAALCDLGEVFNDKFEENDLRIKGMQNTLDWHNRRLLKLETAE